MILQSFGAAITFFFFAIMLDTPRKYLFIEGCIGGIGWFIYLLSDSVLHCGGVLASFLSVLVTATISHIFARKFKTPVTMFLVSGILPTVPGAGMYKIPYYMIVRNSEMTNHHFVETIEAAGAIAFAIFIVDSVVRLAFDKKKKMNESTQ